MIMVCGVILAFIGLITLNNDKSDFNNYPAFPTWGPWALLGIGLALIVIDRFMSWIDGGDDD